MIRACQEWDGEFAVGDIIIDSEHKKIIEMACIFARLVESNALSFREALNMVREVVFHINMHFQHEEMLMDMYNADVAATNMHKQEHAKLKTIFSATIEKIRESSQEELQTNYEELANELYDLVTDHIATVDRETLSPCIRAHDKYFSLNY